MAQRLNNNYLTIKLAIITFVGLVFFVTSVLLNKVIDDRKELYKKAKDNIALSWAGPQTIIGPVLVIPYTDHNLKEAKLRNMVLFPNSLTASADVHPEIRHRGIFDVLVYQADLEFNCSFNPSTFSKNADIIHWEQAKVVVCIDDVRGLNKVSLKAANLDLPVNPGSAMLNNKFEGVHAPLAVTNKDEQINIALKVSLKGSDTLNLLPIAKENKVKVRSNWPDPSFIGQFLPDTKNITKQGFQAEWSISSLASSLPEFVGVGELENYRTSIVSCNDKIVLKKNLGVRFLKAADHYQQAERTSKYSFLFIIYTFLLFFLYEAVKKVKIHIFQYCVTAFSLLYFPILLTSIAEHLSFEIAFWVSALAIISQVSFYIFGILHDTKERVVFTSLLTSLYLYLFIVLRLEEVAFLIGTIGMFIAITVAMYFTRNLKWFEEKYY